MKKFAVLLCLAIVLGACGGDGARTAQPTAPTSPGDSAPAQPTSQPTSPPADAPTQAPVDTATETPTVEPTAVRVARPTPTSSGPLDFQVYVAGCKRAPTADKPGNILITLSVEATGGNGVYRYVHQEVEEPDKFIDINWEQGTRMIGKVTVNSGDGQSLTKEYDVPTGDLQCGS
jgi:hypothetical protein